jgi:deoxyribodipyrimidine photolyase
MWMRNDLRLHDNPVLNWDLSKLDTATQEIEFIPVFCFDPRFYEQ